MSVVTVPEIARPTHEAGWLMGLRIDLNTTEDEARNAMGSPNA